MRICTFFGHRDCPAEIRESVYKAIKTQITEQHTSHFYVGNQGRFDSIVQSVLSQLSLEYPTIHCAVVLAYMPLESKQNSLPEIFPEGLETVHPRYAIVHRNRWMLEKSDVVIAYVNHDWGGAAHCVRAAQRSGKQVVNLYCAEKIPQHKAEG